MAPATDLAQRMQRTVELIDNPAYLDQIEALIGDTMPVRRFVQVAKTAVRTNPDLVTADQRSLFGSILRCAQDGLLPDGREAALVIYKGKVGYLPMIGGLRKIAADHGWTLRTKVVYEEDEFDYTDEPPAIYHKSVRPGVERGPIVAAYAVATNKDGRREQLVLHWDEIAQRKAKAQTDMVWKEWPGQMSEKTVGHAIFKKLPISDRDLVDRVLAADGNDGATDLLYGPDGDSYIASPATPSTRADAAALPDPVPAAPLLPGAGTGGDEADPDGTAAAGSAPTTDQIPF